MAAMPHTDWQRTQGDVDELFFPAAEGGPKESPFRDASPLARHGKDTVPHPFTHIRWIISIMQYHCLLAIILFLNVFECQPAIERT